MAMPLEKCSFFFFFFLRPVTPTGFSEASWNFLDLYVNQNFFKILSCAEGS